MPDSTPVPLHSFAELRRAIDALPPPADGRARTLRGQTKDYRAIPSSFGRVPATADAHAGVRARFEIDFDWDAVGLDWPTDHLFPGPDEDPVYRRLLEGPFFKGVRSGVDGKEQVVRRRAFALPEYAEQATDAARRALYDAFATPLEPTLYVPWSRRNLDTIVAEPGWAAELRDAYERATPVMLQRPHILFSMRRGGPPAPPATPPRVPAVLANFFLEFSPESYALAYDEARMSRGIWCAWRSPTRFLLQSFGTRDGRPFAAERCEFEWLPDAGLVQHSGRNVMSTSYVTIVLDLLQLLDKGELRLDPPGRIGYGYHELTTTGAFFAGLDDRTDLM